VVLHVSSVGAQTRLDSLVVIKGISKSIILLSVLLLFGPRNPFQFILTWTFILKLSQVEQGSWVQFRPPRSLIYMFFLCKNLHFFQSYCFISQHS